ncbi:Hsp70 family protein [Metabacillus indicus]|uniref:Hsp70 family protein n=1 Tax=Metabacillus indicus TaxID=246786 RepID=UPI003180392A
MGIAIGIDLGTSNSAAAVYRKGKLESIPIEGKTILPSVVSYKEDGTILVGKAGKARLFIDPGNSVSSSKRDIGEKDKTYFIQNKTLTPLDIAKEILFKIKSESSRYLGEEVTEAVITIPAYFTDEQREATKKAGELAGLKVLRLLPEPTAAAIAYGLDKERDQTIMVYDLGGGTFDVSVLKVEGNSFRVIAVDGDSFLGGDDFDDKIVEFLLSRIPAYSRQEMGERGSLSLQRLKEAAEEAKKELSVSDFADIAIPDIFNSHLDEELDIDTFNNMIKPLLNRTIEKMQEVLSAANMTKRDISRVILVGGSTRMKAVQEVVAENIKKPFIADNVDEIVAHGAAIMAANLYAPAIDDSPVPIDVVDVVSHSLGIGLINIDDQMEVCHIIRKNTALPCSGAIFGYTRYPFQQSVSMSVYRTDGTIPYEKDIRGELSLPVIPQAGYACVVALFELDENGILTFSSGKIEYESALYRHYEQYNEVNVNLLDQMIKQNILTVEKVIISNVQ